MSREKIILVGAGGHCRSAIDVIETENKYEIAGIVDKEAMTGEDILGYKILGCDGDLEALSQMYKNALVTVGQIRSNEIRVKLFGMLKEIGFHLPVIISPFAYVSPHAEIGEGSIVMHHALINSNVKIGRNCIINTKALIEHDAVIEDHCHLSTASVINGGVTVEANSFIGSNATTKEYSVISGFNKAGSVVK